jgi:hypothetical protein
MSRFIADGSDYADLGAAESLRFSEVFLKNFCLKSHESFYFIRGLSRERIV